MDDSATMARHRAGPVRPPALLDVARGLAMVVVLYGHALEVLFLERGDGVVLASAFVQYKVLASFVMALFFLLSGASAARLVAKGWRGVLRTSLYLLALAYLVHLAGLILLTGQTLAFEPGNLPGLLQNAADSTFKGRNFSTIVVWFLVSLALVRLIVFGLFQVLPRRQAYLTAALLGLGGSLVLPWLPNWLMAKTWPAGVAFFCLGMALAGSLAARAWLAGLVLAPLLVWAALANRGCAFELAASCPSHGLGTETAVWLHIGQIGFVPLFVLAALLGCGVVLGLARGAVMGVPIWSGPARLLARIGKNTLELLVLNGFVLVFLQPHLKSIPIDAVGPWVFPLLLAGVIIVHLLLLRAFARPLAALQRLAFRLADGGVDLLARASARWRSRSQRPDLQRR